MEKRSVDVTGDSKELFPGGIRPIRSTGETWLSTTRSLTGGVLQGLIVLLVFCTTNIEPSGGLVRLQWAEVFVIRRRHKHTQIYKDFNHVQSHQCNGDRPMLGWDNFMHGDSELKQNLSKVELLLVGKEKHENKGFWRLHSHSIDWIQSTV